MRRDAAAGDFRSNLHRGGSACRVRTSAAEREMAIRAAEAVGLGFAGIDILRSARGPVVIDVNASPGLEGIEQATQEDVAERVIEHIERGIGRD
jgi:ribosomal protein S6--L-glutamate ligase